ncbi:glycosyltransferase family 2 protein [bacterium]|nr:glycosyltransferase family 2 protein [bacterium]
MLVDLKFLKEPKISIIITYYNLSNYIEDCIESIMKQTYQNFEVIIVNDFSDNKNTEALKNIKNNKISIINLDSNKGQLLAFIEGLKRAEGEFICMLDADDILLPNHLKTLLYAHLNHNFALISSSCGEINHKNEITSLNYKSNSFANKNNKIEYKEIEKIFNFSDNFKINRVKEPFGLWSWNPSSSGMLRKSALDILKNYPDMNYWKTGADKVVFSLLHLIGGSANISAITYLYRHHDENNSKTKLSVGDKKYLSEEYIRKLISWNKKLRIDTIKMFVTNKAELIKEYNKINYFKMFLKVIFCVNIKICAKIIKTFAHKIIHF